MTLNPSKDFTRPFSGLSTKTNDILFSILVAIVLTAISYIVGAAFGWFTELNWLEVFAVFTSYSCTYLSVRERRFNYPVGAISNAAYCILFLQYGLLASSIVTGYLTFALVYGWFRWGRDEVTKPVEHVKLRWVPVYLLVSLAGYGITLATVTALGATLAPLDSIILVATLVAQFLLDNKKIDNWAVWAVLNVVAIYVYFTAGLPLVGFQYIFFLANTAYGWYMWRKSMKTVEAVHG
jgi:nicotinamide mononucleotide transporter